MPPGADLVTLLGDEMAGLVAAVGRVSTAELGRYAIVGGVAVTVRLGAAHRATSDVDVDVVSAVSGKRVGARFASPAALVAMKLHAIEDRSPTSGIDKRAGDGSDIFQLLVHLDADGRLRSELAGLGPNLRGLVARATDRVLVSGAARTRSWMRSGDAAAAAVTVDELRSVDEPLLAALT